MTGLPPASGSREAWLPYWRPRASGLRLFCFAHAGGRASMLAPWQRGLPPGIEVVPVELPGHGSRINEAPIRRMEPLVEAVATAIGDVLTPPFALFGHSLGAYVALELTRRLAETGRAAPSRLIVSAAASPESRHRDSAPMSDAELLERIRRLGGTPPELLGNEQMRKIMMPVLQADYELLAHYDSRATPPVASPMSLYAGQSDPSVTGAQLEGWKALSPHPLTTRLFPGGHFYLQAHEGLFLEMLVRDLASCVRRT